MKNGVGNRLYQLRVNRKIGWEEDMGLYLKLENFLLANINCI